MNQEKLESAKNLFFIALGIDIAVTALVVISDFWGTGVLKEIGAGRSTADQLMISTFEFWDSFSKLMLLTMLGVGLGLVKWLNTCYSYAKETIGASGFKNERWTAGGWIIPVFNLFKPYQVINEIYKAGSLTYAAPDGWKKERGSGLLLTWWIFYSVTHFIGWIVGKQMFKSAMRDDLTLQQSISAIEFHASFCMVFLTISGLWFLVAGNLTRRLLERQRVGVAPILHGQLVTASQPVPPRNTAPTQAGTSSPAPIQMSVSQSAGPTSQATANPTQFIDQTQSPTPMLLSSSIEEDFWATAMNEVETGQRRPGVWAKAFAECDGDETKAKVAYLKVRVQQLMDVERVRQAEVARDQVELQEQERIRIETQLAAQKITDTAHRFQLRAGVELAEKQITDTVSRFQAGTRPSCDDVKLLVSTATWDSKVAHLREHLTGNSLLHWCALLDLYQEAATLLRHGADATEQNGDGRQPYQLADDYAVNALLKAAANKPKGTCPNCATVMPLTSQICPKCSAI